MSEPKKHVVIKLAHSFIVAVWAAITAVGVAMVAPLIAVFEIPAMRRYMRMESM